MQLSRFAAAAKNIRLDTSIQSDTRWLADGRHAVTIEDSNPEHAAEAGKLELVFRDPFGKLHADKIWITTRDGGAFSFEMRQLMGATLPSVEAQQQFCELIAGESTFRRVLESFRGMKVLVELESNAGFRIERDVQTGDYVAVHTNGDIVGAGRTREAADAAARAAGYEKSYRKLVRIEVLDEDNKELNLSAFGSIVASIKKTEDAAGVAAPVQFDGYTESPTGT